jgi:hypothetical protein
MFFSKARRTKRKSSNQSIDEDKLNRFIAEKVDLVNRNIFMIDEQKKTVSMNFVIPKSQKTTFIKLIKNFEWSPHVMGNQV